MGHPLSSYCSFLPRAAPPSCCLSWQSQPTVCQIIQEQKHQVGTRFGNLCYLKPRWWTPCFNFMFQPLLLPDSCNKRGRCMSSSGAEHRRAMVGTFGDGLACGLQEVLKPWCFNGFHESKYELKPIYMNEIWHKLIVNNFVKCGSAVIMNFGFLGPLVTAQNLESVGMSWNPSADLNLQCKNEQFTVQILGEKNTYWGYWKVHVVSRIWSLVMLANSVPRGWASSSLTPSRHLLQPDSWI